MLSYGAVGRSVYSIAVIRKLSGVVFFSSGGDASALVGSLFICSVGNVMKSSSNHQRKHSLCNSSSLQHCQHHLHRHYFSPLSSKKYINYTTSLLFIFIILSIFNLTSIVIISLRFQHQQKHTSIFPFPLEKEMGERRRLGMLSSLEGTVTNKYKRLSCEMGRASSHTSFHAIQRQTGHCAPQLYLTCIVFTSYVLTEGYLCT